MRKIGREHERIRPHPLDRVRQRLFVTLAAHEDSVVGKIIGGMPLELEPAILQFALEPIEHERNPRRAALHETDAQSREPVKHSVDHHSGQSDRQRERHSEGARCGKNGIGVEAKIDVAAAMHRHDAVEFLRFLVNRPVLGMANMTGEPIRGNHRAEEPELFDRAA